MKLLPKFLLLNLLIWFMQSALAADGKCHISGYTFPLKCATLHGSPAFDVEVFTVEARVRYPKPTPVIWIPDGLATVATERAPFIINALSRLRNHRDLMWLELKHSNGLPPLDCQTNNNSLQNHPFHFRLSPTNDHQLRQQCMSTLLALGDLKQADHKSIAQIYENMVKHYGLKNITVYAEGRGALIANAWQQIAPDRIAFQVYDSPPRMPNSENAISQAVANEIALKKVFEDCKQSALCRRQFKHEIADWLQLIQKLPTSTYVKDPITLQNTHLTITSDMLAFWTTQLLRQPSKSRYLPLLLTHAATGDWQPMLGILTNSWQIKMQPLNHALAIAEQCAYGLQNKVYPQNKLGPAADWFYQSERRRNQTLCSGLKQHRPAPMQWHAHTPTLLLLGMASPSTETSWKNIQNYTAVKVPGAGHGLLSHECTRDVVYRYFKLRDESMIGKHTPPLEANCLSKIPYPHMEMRDPSTNIANQERQP